MEGEPPAHAAIRSERGAPHRPSSIEVLDELDVVTYIPGGRPGSGVF